MTSQKGSNNNPDNDSDVIICDEDEPEIIVIPSSPSIKKKAKKKKHKRKVMRGIYDNNMETLLVTQKLQMKKTRFKCIININTINKVCEKKSCDSIVRYRYNVCRKEAYYQRILPVCMRETCYDHENRFSRCCRSTRKKYSKSMEVKDENLSLVSSKTFSDIMDCKNISYEDVSNGSFSCVSEEELETLIKRTKLRESKCSRPYTAPEYITSTPLPKFQDIPSPFSLDMNKSLHSDTTMVLNPLSSAYSPTGSPDYINFEQFGDLESSILNVNEESLDIDMPYSATTTPGLIKRDLTSIDSANARDYDIRYSPTFNPESMKLENMDYVSELSQKSQEFIHDKKLDTIRMGDVYNYTSAAASHLVENNNSNIFISKNKLNDGGADTSHLICIKMSDTINKTEFENVNDTNVSLSSAIMFKHDNIKVEMIDVVSEIIKNNNNPIIESENVKNPNPTLFLTDYRDKKLNIKSERNDDSKCEGTC